MKPLNSFLSTHPNQRRRYSPLHQKTYHRTRSMAHFLFVTFPVSRARRAMASYLSPGLLRTPTAPFLTLNHSSSTTATATPHLRLASHPHHRSRRRISPRPRTRLAFSLIYDPTEFLLAQVYAPRPAAFWE
ncbi:uncharacterized protein STEHIDRAFT_168528 [Stereum hirsutum FP-91666 SS1]|uniref:uncharacterized protein n=1 Tax=Stereum hirsutum (strain FP-91666) TaxID=721885 RepID=UPI000440F7D6|nr:uncharacterized protein STEHIDRAFT_168528 [Stereum hirsutum FP-91666 SS1]EIM86561.1 hypothetical protein STEHIDRAFT_168528 [Stereum hirsutum FP-91666 SS1]